ncbi:class I adenylate-forming enzyme family protein [Methylolobus aquaticus]
MTLATLLVEACRSRPLAIALIDGLRRWTYAELDVATDCLAEGWRRRQVQPGDRVALFMPNCAELAFAYLACFKLGAVAVPLNARYKGPEVAHALVDSGASSLAVHISRWPEVESLDLAALGVMDCHVVGTDAPPPGTLLWDALLVPTESLPPPATFGPEQPAAILYTSGSTSRPKGVVYTHGTLSASNRIQTAAWQLDPHDIQLITLSFAHAAALSTQLLPSLALGGTSVLLDAPTPGETVAAIRAHGCTRLVMLPAVLADLVDHLEHQPADLRSLRSAVAGGDIVPQRVQELFHQSTGLEISEVWGMTECLGSINNPPFGSKVPGSIGRPAPEVSVKLIDPDGQEVADGNEGEILIRSPALTVGYWNNPAATAAAIVDGWLHTGDLARRDPDGVYWFLGRRKEIIVRGGSNISPLEVEEVIAQHPAVLRVGVVGFPDARLGQIVVAGVMLDADQPSPSEDELRQFSRERIATYKTPERIHFLPELPLNPVGKVDRHRLLALLQGEGAVGATPGQVNR